MHSEKMQQTGLLQSDIKETQKTGCGQNGDKPKRRRTKRH